MLVSDSTSLRYNSSSLNSITTLPEIARAELILETYAKAEAAQTGAVGLEGAMIDKPMVLQAEGVLRRAGKGKVIRK